MCASVKSLDLEVARPGERGHVVWQLSLPLKLPGAAESPREPLGTMEIRVITCRSFKETFYPKHTHCHLSSLTRHVISHLCFTVGLVGSDHECF